MVDDVQKFPIEQVDPEELAKVMSGPGPLIGAPVLNKEFELVKKLQATTDAMVWAQEWCKIAWKIHDEQGVEKVIDEGWMVGWFANAFATQELHDRLANEKALANGVEEVTGPEHSVGGFDFQREHDGSLSLESAVFQALGYASLCWSKIPGGIFESDKAKDAGDKLVEFIKFIKARENSAL